MAQPIPIVTDPISSDGSEESWILLDEMDEAMREEFNGALNLNETKNDEITGPATSEVALVEEASSPEIEMVIENDGSGNDDVDSHPILTNEEPSVDYPSNIETMSSAEAISACPSNDDDDDDIINDAERIRRVLEKSNVLKVYDDLNDGSTTDGSISIIGEGEHNQHRQEEIIEGHGFETDELSTSPSTTTTTAASSATASSSVPQPLQMWMRCTPIDMSICSKRPLPPRPYEPHRCQRPTSVAELGLAEQNIASDLLNYLERLNNFLSSIYLLQVFLLFLTAGSVALLAIIYSRYSACKLEIKDLEQKLYSTKADKYQIEGNLARCEYLYEMEMEKTTIATPANSDFKPATDGDVKVTIDPAIPTQTEGKNFGVKPEIQPTRRLASTDENFLAGEGKLQTVWTGADDNLIATKKPHYNTKEKRFADVECSDIDDGSLFSEYNREYCENQKKNQPAKVYATHYSYKAIDDGECNPNKIDFTLGIEHARKILRETNCDDDGTLKYLEKAYENFEANTNNEQSMKRHKKHAKTAEKSNGKLEKAQKINSSVIKIDKYNDENDDEASSMEDRIERKEKRSRRADKKFKRNDAVDHDDGDKENNRRRKSDRKDATTTTNKKFNTDKDKDIVGKRIKNDRKRDMVKIYEHRLDD